MADSGVFTNIFTLIDDSIINVVIGKAGTLISVLEPLLLSSFSVYLLFLFLSYWNSSIEESIVDFVKRCIAWILILSFSLNIGYYNEYIVPMVMNFGDFLSQKFSGSNTTIDGSLDDMATIVLNGIQETLKEANGISATVLAIIIILLIAISSIIFLIISAGYILLAKVFAGILVVVGPIFIAMALFPATRQYFSAWVNQVVNYALLTFFLNVLMAIFIEFMVGAFGTGYIDLTRGLNIAIGAGIFFVVLLRLPELSSSLAGGLSANGFTQATRSLLNASKAVKGFKSGGKSGGYIGKA
uniref:VirB6-like protein n=1 Tax=Moraxella bovis TaxID=476 RepID=Q5KT87_MORBO|nr:type IV secretion system protein [Moraxella bovis]BAD83763.1 VirB6-like protein [Moraxella bovis Epp63]